MDDLESKMTKEELLASVGASDFKSAPEDVINSITKGTIPDATPLAQAPPLEQSKITEGEVFKPSKQLLEWLSTTGERRAQPIRNPASAFFNINSIDRYASKIFPTSQFALILQQPEQLAATPASSYNMNLGRNLMSGYFHRLTVTDANVSWNIPTINSQNYIFCMTVINGAEVGTAVVTLPLGYYNYATLAEMMQKRIIKAFSGAGDAFNLVGLTVTWRDPDQATNAVGRGSFFIQTPEPGIEIAFVAAFPSDYTGTPSAQFPNEGSIIPGTTVSQAQRAMYKFYTMIGVTSQIVLNFQYQQNTTPTYPTLIYTSYIDIISNKLSQFMRVKDSETSWSADTSVITRVYLTNQGTITAPTVQYTDLSGNPAETNQQILFTEYAVGSRPFILNYTPTTPKNIKWSPDQAVVDFDIRVVDEFGDRLPWNLNLSSNGTDPAGTLSYTSETFEFQLTVLCSET